MGAIMLAAFGIVPFNAQPFAWLVCYGAHIANGTKLMLQTEPFSYVVSCIRHLRKAAWCESEWW